MKQPKIGLINTWAFLDDHIRCILDAGGLPVMLPVAAGAENAPHYVDMLDGLLIPGGEDVTPFLYGQEPVPQVKLIRRDKDDFEMALIRAAVAQHKPVFGICRGQQLINVTLGGTLVQDVPTQGGSISHHQDGAIPDELLHSVEIEKDSHLYKLFGKTRLEVNTYHHQAVKEAAPDLRVVATAPDGIVEAIESKDGYVFGVQWHPECLCKKYPEFLALFRRLVELSRKD